MNQPLLTILIPTTIERTKEYLSLREELDRQRKEFNLLEKIIIEFDDRGKEIPIGEKREDMYQKSNGLYSVQWDSDDGISMGGLKKIIDAIETNPLIDCITYEEYINIDGKEMRGNHSIKYEDWMGDGNKELSDGFHFWRTPFMKSVIRTDIAREIPIPHIRFGEDHQFAIAIKPYLKTETHIPEQIYRYIHISSNHTERYGFDKDKK